MGFRCCSEPIHSSKFHEQALDSDDLRCKKKKEVPTTRTPSMLSTSGREGKRESCPRFQTPASFAEDAAPLVSYILCKHE